MTINEEVLTAIESRLSERHRGVVWSACPFHDDRNLSLAYRIETHSWYCYACHREGTFSIEEAPAVALPNQLGFAF